MSNQNEQAYRYLIDHLCQNNDKEQVTQFMSAILTQKEQQEMANRILIFAMLQQGKPQREISETLKVAIATVSRGAKAFHEHNIQDVLPNLSQELTPTKE